MTDRTENMRLLIDIAVQSGKKRQNKFTGYIHSCYEAGDEDNQAVIPIVENFLFTLALLRSRTIENINEAKVLLERLLHFQAHGSHSKYAGNLPVYIHEYPACNDRFTAVPVSLAVYWILKLFSQVLGSELKGRLIASFNNMLDYIVIAHADKPAPYQIALKIGTLCLAGGSFLHRTDLESTGKNMLDELHSHPDKMPWYCPATLGSMLSALMLLYPRLSESPWAAFWKHLENTWHRNLCCYIGPAFKEWQDGEEPQATLYDLFLGYFSGKFSARALKDSILHLEAALIPACEDIFQDAAYPHQLKCSLDNEAWYLYKDSLFAYCFIEKHPVINPAMIKGFHPVRIVWGSDERVHTFVCQGGNSKHIGFVNFPEGIDIIFDLDAIVDSEEREKNREIIFFIDAHEGLETLVSESMATTFSLGEELLFRSGMFELSMVFNIVEGEGKFLGHRMLGNRPSQLRLRKQRYEAYDWQFFLRTIKRSEPCIVKVSLSLRC